MSLLARQLDAYLAAHARAHFDWRTLNCCHFAAGWLALVTGARPMDGLPETPAARDALRLVGSHVGGLAGAVTQRLARASVAPALARLGDIVLAPTGADGAAVGICNGRTAAFMTLEEGLTFLPMASATHAWRLRAEGSA